MKKRMLMVLFPMLLAGCAKPNNAIPPVENQSETTVVQDVGKTSVENAVINVSDTVIISEANFPDENFREYLLAEKDIDNSGGLSDEELQSCKNITTYEPYYIQDFTGIELLPDVQDISFYGNCYFEPTDNGYIFEDNGYCLKSLDLSKNYHIRTVFMDGVCVNNDTVININQTVERLEIDGSNIRTFDTFNYPNLTSLCLMGDYMLEEIDISNNSVLENLNLGDDVSLTSIDLSGVSALTNLGVSGKRIEVLDLSNNPNLRVLGCGGAYAYTAQATVQRSPLKEIIIPAGCGIEQISCRNSCIEELDIQNCPNLWRLECVDNYVDKLNFSRCPDLRIIMCNSNNIHDLNITGTALAEHFLTTGKLNGDKCEFEADDMNLFIDEKIYRYPDDFKD